jgi:hypothetical protein
LALLLAIALFAAQAINLALVLRDRANFRLAQATRPAAVRIADALERADERPILEDRGRVRRRAANPLEPAWERHPDRGRRYAGANRGRRPPRRCPPVRDPPRRRTAAAPRPGAPPANR